MISFPFAKVVPGGNPTILIPAHAVPFSQLAETAQSLMASDHIQAEQVGSLSFTTTSATLPHLQMMGGEFCVNATRASAALLANARQLPRNKEGCCAGHMTISGVSSPVLVVTAPTKELLASTITTLQTSVTGKSTPTNPASDPLSLLVSPPALPADFEPAGAPSAGALSAGAPSAGAPSVEAPSADWPSHITDPVMYSGARLTCAITPTTFEKADKGMVIVHLPGISHLLIPVSPPSRPFPTPHTGQTAELATHYRMQYGLDNYPASGTIWFKRLGDRFSILPAVYVKDTDSLCMETACGSASLALGLYTCFASGNNEAQPIGSFAIQQPSGHTLTVTIARTSESSCHAWVTGITHIPATGEAYL